MSLFRRRQVPAWAEQYLDVPRPDVQKPWREASYSVLDVETSGLNARRDVILSIGLVEIDDGRIRMDHSWYTLVRPPEQFQVSAESIRVHGLLVRDVQQAPPATEVLPELVRRLAGRVLVVHFASIDIDFLSRALRSSFGIKLRGPAIDTVRLAGALNQRNQVINSNHVHEQVTMKLSSLAKQAGLPVHSQHNALSDALTTAQLFLWQATRFQQKGTCTLHDLLRAGACLR
jgi:DNA polymerase-3 subunit epsilon